MKLFVSLILILHFQTVTFSQKIDSTKSKIDYVKLGVIGGLTTGGFIYGHILQSNLWWKGEQTDFHFNWQDDWTYALGADKLGHFYFSFLTTNIYSQAFQWAGIEKNKSLWYAGGLALSYQTYIEIKDGFSEGLGFSWGDWIANLLGSAYPLLQEYEPALKNFNFKISFYPSQRFQNNSHSVIIDDYESTYHWLSVNINNILPDDLEKHYPDFINLAIGHSVNGLNNLDNANHEIYIALDWNLEGLPGDGWFWNLLKKNLNYYHLPSPAIKIYPGVVWYGIKF